MNRYLMKMIHSESAEAIGELIGTKVVSFISPRFVYADLFLTEDCNHRCTYCFVKDKSRRRPMTWETARQSIDFMFQQAGRSEEVHFLFFGGEPLLMFPLIQSIVEYGKEQGAVCEKKVFFDITTNGTLLDEHKLRFFQTHGIKFLLSIDGDHESHDRHRRLLGGGSSFNAVMKNLRLIKRYQPWLGTRMTVVPETVSRVYENVKFLFGRGINQFIIGLATGIPWAEEDLYEYEKQMWLLADFYIELKKKRAPFRMTFFEKDLEAKQVEYEGNWGCGAGRGRVCISANGELYGCAKILGVDSLRDAHKLGDIWRGVTNISARLDLLNTSVQVRPKCLNCDLGSYCTGGCPATNYEETGSIYLPSSLDCQLTRIFRDFRVRLERRGFWSVSEEDTHT